MCALFLYNGKMALYKKNIRRRQLVKSRVSSEEIFEDELKELPEKLQEILFSRGINSKADMDYGLANLIPPNSLLNTDKASLVIYEAIKMDKKLLIVGDFDADGATSSALMIKALHLMGAKQVNFLVPDRFKFGYGLSVKLVEAAALNKPDIIITVDNGIANNLGVARANDLGIPVIITDHHLPAEQLPEALVIVNPNQPEDKFPSKNLAGVGVAFYLMLAVRQLLRENNWFAEKEIPEPNLAELLDLVALGTVADVVVLDKNNRILVEQGLRRIRSGKACFGIKALLEVSKKQFHKCTASDLGYALGPRLNAAGRLQDMSIGINCLLALSANEAQKIASQLDNLNYQRRNIEEKMLHQATQDLNEYLSRTSKKIQEKDRPTTLCLFDENWHQGVIGILASRIKDKINRPVIVFAADDSGEVPMIKGSARSVKGVHIRDVLALVDSQNPELIEKFGGHAMAAGLSLQKKDFQRFADKFLSCTTEFLNGRNISDDIITDGRLAERDMTLFFAQQLKNSGPWGQGFPEPIFDDEFQIVSHRVVAEKHLKLILKKGNIQIDAIHFFFDETLSVSQGNKIHAVFKLDINEFRNVESLQLIVESIKVP